MGRVCPRLCASYTSVIDPSMRKNCEWEKLEPQNEQSWGLRAFWLYPVTHLCSWNCFFLLNCSICALNFLFHAHKLCSAIKKNCMHWNSPFFSKINFHLTNHYKQAILVLSSFNCAALDLNILTLSVSLAGSLPQTLKHLATVCGSSESQLHSLDSIYINLASRSHSRWLLSRTEYIILFIALIGWNSWRYIGLFSDPMSV